METHEDVQFEMSNKETPPSTETVNEDNTKETSLEDVVKYLVPNDFSLSKKVMDVLLTNTLKDKSIIINEMEAYGKQDKVMSVRGRRFSVPKQCDRCKKIFSTSSNYNLLNAPMNHLPKVPCPSCHKPSTLILFRRYLCPSCEDTAYCPNIPKIVCTSCKVADITDPNKGESMYLTVNDFLRHGIMERPFINSANPLFQRNNNYLRPLRNEHRRRLYIFLSNRNNNRRKE